MYILNNQYCDWWKRNKRIFINVIRSITELIDLMIYDFINQLVIID